MDWDKLKIFHTVAEATSFTKASTILNLSQSAISRQIQALETDLKVQLFERHARGLVLTENGEYLYKSAHEIISKLKDVNAKQIHDPSQEIINEFHYPIASMGTSDAIESWTTVSIRKISWRHNSSG